MSARQTDRNRQLFERAVFRGETLESLAREHRRHPRTIQRLVLDEARRRGFDAEGGVSAVREHFGGKGYRR